MTNCFFEKIFSTPPGPEKPNNNFWFSHGILSRTRRPLFWNCFPSLPLLLIPKHQLSLIVGHKPYFQRRFICFFMRWAGYTFWRLYTTICTPYNNHYPKRHIIANHYELTFKFNSIGFIPLPQLMYRPQTYRGNVILPRFQLII